MTNKRLNKNRQWHRKVSIRKYTHSGSKNASHEHNPYTHTKEVLMVLRITDDVMTNDNVNNLILKQKIFHNFNREMSKQSQGYLRWM